MLNCRVNVGGSLIRGVSEQSPVLRQGMALAYVLEDGEGKVTQSDGVKPFAGVAYNEYKMQDRMTAMEEFVAVGTTYKLGHQAIGGTVQLYDLSDDSNKAAVMEADSQTIKELVDGTKYKAVYAFVPSALDVYTNWNIPGEGLPGFVATDIVNSISVIVAGDVYVDYFDVTTDFSVKTPKAGASGLFSKDGVAIQTAQVISLPSPNRPLLGLYIAL